MVDLRRAARGRVVEPELRLREVADHRLDPLRPRPSRSMQPLELLRRALADEDVDVALALEQPLDEVAADEARGAGDEVGHVNALSSRARASREPRLPAKRCAPARAAGQRSSAELGLERQALRRVRGLAVGAASSPAGTAAIVSASVERARDVLAGRDDLGDEADRERLVGVDGAAGEDRGRARGRGRRRAAAAACRRRSAARPSGARRSRTWRVSSAIRRSHQSASSSPPARHQPAIAAIVGLGEARRVKPSGPPGASASSVSIAFRSAPAQNASSPAPVSTSTRASSSAAKRSNAVQQRGGGRRRRRRCGAPAGRS